MPTPENIIKYAICDYLNTLGIYHWVNDSVAIFDPKTRQFRRFNSKYKKKGVSDILGILPDGRFLAIEVKTETGRTTPEQKEFLLQINNRGGIGIVARSIDEVSSVLGYCRRDE